MRRLSFRPAPARAARLVLALLGLGATGCERLLVEPAAAPQGIALSLSVPEDGQAQLSTARGEPDRIRVQVESPDLVLLDTLFVFQPGTREVLVPVLFTASERTAVLRVELRRGALPLLRGSAPVQMLQRRVADVEVPLHAAAAGPLAPTVQVSAGIYHSCAATEEGRVSCWGLNETGQLGDDTRTSRPLPAAVRGAGLPAFQSVGASYVASCALAADGRAFCWGANERGALGTGAGAAGSLVPTPVGTELRFASLSVGGLHACGLTAQGAAHCWGFNRFGQLGGGTTTDAPTPVAVAAPAGVRFRALSAGYLHTCGVTVDDQLYCWGLNEFGQLGDGTARDRSSPVRIGGLPPVRQVSAGGLHTCAVGTAGQLLCWGFNRFGQLGVGSTGDRSTPTAVAGVQMQQVSAGGLHSCGVAAGGQALCWGYNRSGAVGDGSRSDRAAPTPVADGLVARSVSAGLHHSCGVAADGRALCWGYNRYGQVGDGSAENRVRATEVLDAEAFFTGSRAPSGALREAIDLLLAGVVRP